MENFELQESGCDGVKKFSATFSDEEEELAIDALRLVGIAFSKLD